MALYDPRTNGERLLATGAVEMDNPCDCLLFNASLVRGATRSTCPSICVVRGANIWLPAWLQAASESCCGCGNSADAKPNSCSPLSSGLACLPWFASGRWVSGGIYRTSMHINFLSCWCPLVTANMVVLGVARVLPGSKPSQPSAMVDSACRPPGNSFLRLPSS